MSDTNELNIDELIPDDRNANRGNEEGQQLIERSFKAYGAGRSVLLDKDGRLIAGNKSHDAAKKAGIKKVRVIETTGEELIAVKRTDISLDSKEGREMAIADNATAKANIEFDFVVLDELEEEHGIEMESWGIVSEEDEETQGQAQDDEYEIPDEIKTDIVPGDLFEFRKGDLCHRLLCGDSTDSDAVAKLMNGKKVEILLTDPPYGINLDTDYSKMPGTSTRYKKIKGDENEFNLRNVLAIGGTTEQYIWGGDYFVNSIDWMKGTQIIWAKRHSEEENKVFGSAYESLWVSYKCKKLIWYIRPINQSSERLGRHPTQKPVECMSRCILMSKLNGSIYDPFLGSGTTMVAAHQLNRNCYGMELDEKYCQVIVDRMMQLDPEIEVFRNGEPYINNG